MAAKFPNIDLVACAQREVAMREKAYPKWEHKESIAECSEKRQQEYAMMQAIAEQLAALPTLLERYQQQKDVLRDITPQPHTFDYPHEGIPVLVYCTNYKHPFLAKRIGLNEWAFEHTAFESEDVELSKHVIAFSYLPSLPSTPTTNEGVDPATA